MTSQTTSLCRVAAAAALGRADALREQIGAALDGGVSPRECYEVILQNYLFAGFPAALEGLRVFTQVVTEREDPFVPPDARLYNVREFRRRGMKLAEQIYRTNISRLLQQIGAWSPDMLEWMLIEGYGKVLSRHDLEIDRRELAIVSVLAALGWTRQLISHARGAIHVGASEADVEQAIAVAAEFVPSLDAHAAFEQVIPHLPR